MKIKCKKLQDSHIARPDNPNVKILYEECNKKLTGLTAKLSNLTENKNEIDHFPIK